jgi:hypothetical protein
LTKHQACEGPIRCVYRGEYEDIEEAKLDEAWDLTLAEDAPTECLADLEERNDNFKYTNP